MGLTKVGEISPPLTSGEISISIGTNPKDVQDGYFYFNTGDAPVLIKFKALLKDALNENQYRLFDKTDVKKFGDANVVAQGFSKKEHLQAYASVLAKMGVVKSNKISKIKKYNDIIDNVETTSKNLYKPSGIKATLETLGVSPTWSNYEGHFVGTLVNSVCLTKDKAAIEESPFYAQNIKKLLNDTGVTLMGPVAFLREANWVVTEGNLSLQSDGGADFTDLVLGMLNTSASAFAKMVKEGDGTASSLGVLGVDPAKLAKAAKNHTDCGATGDEKIRNACIALGGSPSEATTEAPSSGGILEQLETRLIDAEKNYNDNPSPVYLKMWGKLMVKFKEVVAKKSDDQELTEAYKKWLAKYNAAKDDDGQEETTTESNEKDETAIQLEKKIIEIELRRAQVESDTAPGMDELVNEYSFLMGGCQLIAATPNYKAVFKRHPDLKETFNNILNQIQQQIENNTDLKKELMRQIKEAAKVGEEFKAEGERLWNEFRDYTKTIATPLEARIKLEEVEKSVKEFQQKVEQRSRGLILLSKKAGVGNAAKISEHMTAVRSRATKLKSAIQAQLKVANEHLVKMETLMAEFNRTFDVKIQTQVTQVIQDFRNIEFSI